MPEGSTAEITLQIEDFRLQIFAATGNPGKLREFVRHSDSGIEVLLLPGFADIPPCQETGTTFEENARLKAAYYSRYTEGLVFSDDSGLEVDALNGAPGVYSARFAGSQANDQQADDQNNARLIAELSEVPIEQRTARYVCVITLARGGEVLASFQGAVSGVILQLPRGTGGFGYDPYFFFPPLQRTFAEISGQEKWEHSHRGQAFRKMLAFLRIIHSRGQETT
jgi:XTP/dITP diphosphohydrolase